MNPSVMEDSSSELSLLIDESLIVDEGEKKL